MIYQEYLPFESLLPQMEKKEIKLPYPLEYTIEKIEKLKKKTPKSYDNIARILALSRPVVDLILFKMDYHEPERAPNSKGRPNIPIQTLILIHLLAQTMISDSYRQTERVLNANPMWLKALNLKKSPSHATMSKFRKTMGFEFFDTYFHQLTELLFAFGLIMEGDDVIIDSAPIEASQNFARSNSGIQINEEKLNQFFNAVDFTPAVSLIAPACNHGRKRKYSNEVLLKFIAFEKLCGFLSRSQALNHLKKHLGAATIVGFNAGDIPSTSTISNSLKRIPPIPWLMRVMVDSITEFFESQSEYDDHDPLSFFFRSF
jgi:transposase